MSIVVQKFGGTSVADPNRIRNAAARAVEAKRAGHQVVMVVSARGKKTDELVTLAAEITSAPRPREMDMLLSTGEQESVALMAMAVHEMGEEATSLTGAQIGVRTDGSYTKARIISISTQRMKELLDAGQIVIAAGFQGVDENLNITTLGRGGSDTTAAALAAVLDAELCEIYTDVEGVFTTDPRVVPGATKIDQVSYDEMLELASLGAGVMHSRSIEFAKKYKVNLKVRPSFKDGPGTLIALTCPGTAPTVTGVAFVREESRISLVEVPDQPGVMSSVFATLSENRIPVDMVVQNIGINGRANVSFTVAKEDLTRALDVAKIAVERLGGSINHQEGLAKVSVVGRGMLTHSGVAAAMFQILAAEKINIHIVTTSEIKISVLVDQEACDRAVLAVHDGFHLNQEDTLQPHVGTVTQITEAEVAEDQDRSQLQADIVAQLSTMEDTVVSDVYADVSQGRVTISNLPDEPGVASSIFNAVAEAGIMVDMIVQNAARGEKANISFTVPEAQIASAVEVVQTVLANQNDVSISSAAPIGKLSVVGIGLRSHTEVGAQLFETLSSEKINVDMVNTSEIKVSVAVHIEQTDSALTALRKAFGLNQ